MSDEWHEGHVETIRTPGRPAKVRWKCETCGWVGTAVKSARFAQDAFHEHNYRVQKSEDGKDPAW